MRLRLGEPSMNGNQMIIGIWPDRLTISKSKILYPGLTTRDFSHLQYDVGWEFAGARSKERQSWPLFQGLHAGKIDWRILFKPKVTPHVTNDKLFIRVGYAHFI
jgi:hypothetical protein